MKKISTHTFKYTLRDIHKNTENRKFCFVIGAGASRKSGIPTGGELAEKWYKEISEILDKPSLTSWKKEQKIDAKKLAASYGSIYRKRFENDKTSGYEFLVQAMKSAKPNFGHIVLAQILSRSSGHCIITTNFDSLVETSVYQFTDKTPLVCGHESLSGYARPSHTHPLIIKIHRDLLLSPKSDPDEINKLDPGWKEPLDHIFSTHIPIVIGYGGNDGSLMDYFQKMNKPSNFFWCGINEESLSDDVKKLIIYHDGSFVKIEGFDELMHELLWVFDEIKPIKDELKDITNERVLIASKQLDEITSVKIKPNLPSKRIISSGDKKELSALEYSNLADKELDFEKRKSIYLEALSKYPSTSWLWESFTYFLHFVKKEYDDLEIYYQKALTASKKSAGLIENYALFLDDIEGDYNKAEECYTKALAMHPDSATFNGNYAVFLDDRRKDFDKAEKHYLKALSLDPEDSMINNNYAIFLKVTRKDYGKAEKHYLKAITNDPKNSDYQGSYANFLKTINKDSISAEKYYIKALELDTDNAVFNGNYAQLLLEQGRIHEAEKFIDKAFNNNLEQNDLEIELWFYRYAHFHKYLSEAENKIEKLLIEDTRSLNWDFDGNIKQAIRDKHSNIKKLKEFAKRITSK